MTNWTLAARAAKMNPSAIREILKLTDKPGIISLAGGLPSPKAFPLQEFTAACNTVMARDGCFPPLATTATASPAGETAGAVNVS